ncbi:thiamine phosphate synthase [Micromonospora sp. NPDC002575]|uniref:thiamine phosphate synthase n=1 Tax=Micromonospora sp. NPDC002575 TaxID=3364222 RepID=UPI00369D52EC
MLTDRRVLPPGALARVVAGAVAGGVRWVVLREKDLPRAERAALAAELRPILAEAGGTLVVAGPDPLGGDAVHLPAAGPYPPPRPTPADHAPADSVDRPGPADRPGLAGRPDPAGQLRPWLVGRSCHDAAELAGLTTEDYATLSPVYPSRSKPGYGPPLGPRRLGELIRFSPVPVLALGGIETPDQVRACVEAGAAGVAVQGAIMRAKDPAEAAAELTAAWAEARSRHPRAEAERTGLRPTVPTQGSSLTARSGHGRPQPPTATTAAVPAAPTAAPADRRANGATR